MGGIRAGDVLLSWQEQEGQRRQGTLSSPLQLADIGDDVLPRGARWGWCAPSSTRGRSVLASLWFVGDRSAATFRRRSYASLAGGASKAEALRAAQRQAVRDGWPPSRWASFQLYGDPGGRGQPVGALRRKISGGEVAEGLKAPVLKTGVPQGIAGSNPVLSASRPAIR